MERKKCTFCGTVIPADKRADSKFCSNSCKANYWEKHKNDKAPVAKAPPEKEIPKPAGKPLEGLRGVIENKPLTDVSDVKETSVVPKTEPPPVARKETTLYRAAFEKKKKAETEYNKIIESLSLCDEYVTKWKRTEEVLLQKQRKRRYMPTDVDAILAWEASGWEDDVDITEQIKNAQKEIRSLIQSKSKLEHWQPIVKKMLDEANNLLNSIPQYEPEKQPVVIAAVPAPVKPVAPQPQEEMYTRQVEEQVAAPSPIQTNDWLISSRELRAMKFKCLNFQDRWKDFFGLPAVVFHLVVHGLPGEGKSTFCIQFADYLGKNFGEVVYISGEEGWAKTMQDKLKNNNVSNEYFGIARLKSYEEILEKLESNKFHFIFIDSLDTLCIDAARLRELRERHPQSSFITISQSTKDGKMRGSQEIIHDSDIVVKVQDGVATTTKNRYKARGTEFKVFASSSSPSPKEPIKKITEEPRNVI